MQSIFEAHRYPATVLDDLLHVGAEKINDTRLYRCLDRLLLLKTKLEQHLKQRYGELFQVACRKKKLNNT